MVKYSKLTAKQLETMTREERREARKDEKGYVHTGTRHQLE